MYAVTKVKVEIASYFDNKPILLSTTDILNSTSHVVQKYDVYDI